MEPTDDHLIINLRIADMRYPLRVKRREEEIYRKAADEIDYKIGQYKSYFTGSESQALRDTDYMAMTAVQAVAEKVEWQFKANSFERGIKKLTQELDDYLKMQVK
ncbi:cell division protein ZapA [Dysgonomonas sp. 511]|uniref:cell division protein ZapA n=1 Tax=Dysgonomonas sp. 511 TaxID=2302930 RepID=UPI0013D4C0FC|nr:cell division protein ZapA [Dysgonomonas sp. 511]NDV79892.1 cell division protein ZapA [Dysgonomonas sp. 511]